MNIVTNVATKAEKNIKTVIADIPAGISLDTSTLPIGALIIEGNPVSAPSNGLRKICKQAEILSGSTNTAVKVPTDKNVFKTGDVIGTGGGKSYTVTGVTVSNGVTTLATATAIDAVTTGKHIYEYTADAASGAVLKNTPVAILRDAFIVNSDPFVMNGAVTHANIMSGKIGSVYVGLLKGIDEISY